MSATGIPRLGRQMRKPCDRYTCRQHCLSRITEEQRDMVFKEFYALGDSHQQWQYLAQRLGRIIPKSRNVTSTRNYNIQYNFLLNEKKVRVCKVMFLNTLNISDGVCQTALNKCNEDGELIAIDQRGYHSKSKTKE